MKFHLSNDNKKSICGLINKPNLFFYNSQSFISHYSKGSRCKKCEKMLNEQNQPTLKTP